MKIIYSLLLFFSMRSLKIILLVTKIIQGNKLIQNKNNGLKTEYSRYMTGFIVKTKDHKTIRFRFYNQDAPVTCSEFASLLPFTRTLMHARVSGQEIWTDQAPVLDIIQENASVFTEPGEVVFGPLKPTRTKTSTCIGIYYGEGRGLDCCNIFAKVYEKDFDLLKALGNDIWKNGTQELTFEKPDITEERESIK